MAPKKQAVPKPSPEFLAQVSAEKYHWWLKVGLGLQLYVRGVRDWFKPRAEAWYSNLVAEWENEPTKRDPPGQPWKRDEDLAKIENDPQGTQYSHDTAQQARIDFAQVIASHHKDSALSASSTKKINWNHCDASRWGAVDAYFEVMKAYSSNMFGKHAEAITRGLDTADCSGLTQIMEFCSGTNGNTSGGPFDGCLYGPYHFQGGVRGIRNGAWGHVWDLQLDPRTAEKALNTIVRALEDPTGGANSIFANVVAQQCAAEVKKLLDPDFQLQVYCQDIARQQDVADMIHEFKLEMQQTIAAEGIITRGSVKSVIREESDEIQSLLHYHSDAVKATIRDLHPLFEALGRMVSAQMDELRSDAVTTHTRLDTIISNQEAHHAELNSRLQKLEQERLNPDFTPAQSSHGDSAPGEDAEPSEAPTMGYPIVPQLRKMIESLQFFVQRRLSSTSPEIIQVKEWYEEHIEVLQKEVKKFERGTCLLQAHQAEHTSLWRCQAVLDACCQGLSGEKSPKEIQRELEQEITRVLDFLPHSAKSKQRMEWLEQYLGFCKEELAHFTTTRFTTEVDVLMVANFDPRVPFKWQQAEMLSVVEAFGATNSRIVHQSSFLEFTRALQAYRPRFVIISSHGDMKSQSLMKPGIMFCQDAGAVLEVVPGESVQSGEMRGYSDTMIDSPSLYEALRHSLPGEGGRLELVFLNACSTRQLAEELRTKCNTPYVLCWDTKVLDLGAHIFLDEFIKELALTRDPQHPVGFPKKARRKATAKVEMVTRNQKDDTGRDYAVRYMRIGDPDLNRGSSLEAELYIGHPVLVWSVPSVRTFKGVEAILESSGQTTSMFVFVHNNSTFIQGQKASAKALHKAHQLLDRYPQDQNWRVDFREGTGINQYLANMAHRCNGAKLVHRALYDSSNGGSSCVAKHENVWSVAEDNGWEVITRDRDTQGREKGLVTLMVGDMTRLATLLRLTGQAKNAVFVLLCGDADFADCVRDMLALGIRVVVASWRDAVAKINWISEIVDSQDIEYLDEAVRQIGCRDHRSSRPPLEGACVVVYDLNWKDLEQEFDKLGVVWFVHNPWCQPKGPWLVSFHDETFITYEEIRCVCGKSRRVVDERAQPPFRDVMEVVSSISDPRRFDIKPYRSGRQGSSVSKDTSGTNMYQPLQVLTKMQVLAAKHNQEDDWMEQELEQSKCLDTIEHTCTEKLKPRHYKIYLDRFIRRDCASISVRLKVAKVEIKIPSSEDSRNKVLVVRIKALPNIEVADVSAMDVQDIREEVLELIKDFEQEANYRGPIRISVPNKHLHCKGFKTLQLLVQELVKNDLELQGDTERPPLAVVVDAVSTRDYDSNQCDVMVYGGSKYQMQAQVEHVWSAIQDWERTSTPKAFPSFMEGSFSLPRRAPPKREYATTVFNTIDIPFDKVSNLFHHRTYSVSAIARGQRVKITIDQRQPDGVPRPCTVIGFARYFDNDTAGAQRAVDYASSLIQMVISEPAHAPDKIPYTILQPHSVLEDWYQSQSFWDIQEVTNTKVWIDWVNIDDESLVPCTFWGNTQDAAEKAAGLLQDQQRRTLLALSSLTCSSGSVHPELQIERDSYCVFVSEEVQSIKLYPRPQLEGAQIAVQGRTIAVGVPVEVEVGDTVHFDIFDPEDTSNDSSNQQIRTYTVEVWKCPGSFERASCWQVTGPRVRFWSPERIGHGSEIFGVCCSALGVMWASQQLCYVYVTMGGEVPEMEQAPWVALYRTKFSVRRPASRPAAESLARACSLPDIRGVEYKFDAHGIRVCVYHETQDVPDLSVVGVLSLGDGLTLAPKLCPGRGTQAHEQPAAPLQRTPSRQIATLCNISQDQARKMLNEALERDLSRAAAEHRANLHWTKLFHGIQLKEAAQGKLHLILSQLKNAVRVESLQKEQEGSQQLFMGEAKLTSNTFASSWKRTAPPAIARPQQLDLQSHMQALQSQQQVQPPVMQQQQPMTTMQHPAKRHPSQSWRAGSLNETAEQVHRAAAHESSALTPDQLQIGVISRLPQVSTFGFVVRDTDGAAFWFSCYDDDVTRASRERLKKGTRVSFRLGPNRSHRPRDVERHPIVASHVEPWPHQNPTWTQWRSQSEPHRP